MLFNVHYILMYIIIFQYYEMSYGLNVEMHKQVAYAERLKYQQLLKR